MYENKIVWKGTHESTCVERESQKIPTYMKRDPQRELYI